MMKKTGQKKEPEEVFYPKLQLPVQPPVEPMLALLSRQFPQGDNWIYEFKYDGFRAIIFWDGKDMFLQSRDLKPLNRYFPELEQDLRKTLPANTVVDGEIVIETPAGLDFEALQLRIHPAASRVKMLAAQMPASFVGFDLLALGKKNLMNEPFSDRRKGLLNALKPSGSLRVTPATQDRKKAAIWFDKFEGAGIDGIIAKDPSIHYIPGERVMIKVKHQRTADCVVAGFRWNKNQQGEAIGSLLLGLYDQKVLHYVGHAANFKSTERKSLVDFLAPYRKKAEEGGGFGKGRTPGGPSRWSQVADKSWEPLRPELVCEVSYDHMQGDRFRHGTSFIRWRHDKGAKTCTYDQLKEAESVDPKEIFKLSL